MVESSCEERPFADYDGYDDLDFNITHYDRGRNIKVPLQTGSMEFGAHSSPSSLGWHLQTVMGESPG